MPARVIDGAATAKRIRLEIADQIAAKRITPGLAVVLVGEDPASQVYVRNKAKVAEETGIKSWTNRLPADVPQQELLDLVDALNRDPAVHGILVQLPLPKHIDAQLVISSIVPAKDVDGFHPVNVGKLSLGLPCLVPCTPQGCMILIHEVLNDVKGRKAIVLSRSNIVGKPMMQLLLQADCTVTVAHSKTKDLAAECRAADIVVAAIGKSQFVKGDWIKPGAIVIDVGINRVDDKDHPRKTKLVGDVDFAGASKNASAISPVPGGVGPMTIACLLKNTLQVALTA